MRKSRKSRCVEKTEALREATIFAEVRKNAWKKSVKGTAKREDTLVLFAEDAKDKTERRCHMKRHK